MRRMAPYYDWRCIHDAHTVAEATSNAARCQYDGDVSRAFAFGVATRVSEMHCSFADRSITRGLTVRGLWRLRHGSFHRPDGCL